MHPDKRHEETQPNKSKDAGKVWRPTDGDPKKAKDKDLDVDEERHPEEQIPEHKRDNTKPSDRPQETMDKR